MSPREAAQAILSRSPEDYSLGGKREHSLICEGLSCDACFLCEDPVDSAVVWQNAYDFLHVKETRS